MIRGKKVIPTDPDTSLPCPDDIGVFSKKKAPSVNRLFMADRPNKLWVSDFTYGPTWSGAVYVAPRHWARTNGAFNGSIIDVFARRIVGWRASTSMKTRFVLDAPDQAIWQGKTQDNNSLVHHCDRGSHYLWIKYTARLAEAKIDLSVGTVGDTDDTALAECVIGLFKTEVLLSDCKQSFAKQRINQIGPWKLMREVEWETLKWPNG